MLLWLSAPQTFPPVVAIGRGAIPCRRPWSSGTAVSAAVRQPPYEGLGPGPPKEGTRGALPCSLGRRVWQRGWMRWVIWNRRMYAKWMRCGCWTVRCCEDEANARCHTDAVPTNARRLRLAHHIESSINGTRWAHTSRMDAGTRIYVLCLLLACLCRVSTKDPILGTHTNVCARYLSPRIYPPMVQCGPTPNVVRSMALQSCGARLQMTAATTNTST
jgi:hypothetical protein